MISYWHNFFCSALSACVSRCSYVSVCIVYLANNGKYLKGPNGYRYECMSSGFVCMKCVNY